MVKRVKWQEQAQGKRGEVAAPLSTEMTSIDGERAAVRADGMSKRERTEEAVNSGRREQEVVAAV